MHQYTPSSENTQRPKLHPAKEWERQRGRPTTDEVVNAKIPDLTTISHWALVTMGLRVV